MDGTRALLATKTSVLLLAVIIHSHSESSSISFQSSQALQKDILANGFENH